MKIIHLILAVSLALSIPAHAKTGDPLLVPGSTQITKVGNVTTGVWRASVGNITVGNWNSTVEGYATAYIPAGFMEAKLVNGATFAQVSTNGTIYNTYRFGATTSQYVNFNFPMDEAWDGGSMKAKFYWSTNGTGNVTATVAWKISCTQVGNGTRIYEKASGTTVRDTVRAGTNSTEHITNATKSFTPQNTRTKNAMMYCSASRNATGGNSTNTLNLHGVCLQYRYQLKPTAW